jgi:hypothetical protein
LGHPAGIQGWVAATRASLTVSKTSMRSWSGPMVVALVPACRHVHEPTVHRTNPIAVDETAPPVERAAGGTQASVVDASPARDAIVGAQADMTPPASGVMHEQRFVVLDHPAEDSPFADERVLAELLKVYGIHPERAPPKKEGEMRCSPPLRIAWPDVPGGLAARRVLVHATPELVACYDKRGRPREGETVAVTLVIGPSGSVSALKVAAPDQLAACAEHVIGQLMFPRPSGGSVTFTGAVTFIPDCMAPR